MISNDGKLLTAGSYQIVFLCICFLHSSFLLLRFFGFFTIFIGLFCRSFFSVLLGSLGIVFLSGDSRIAGAEYPCYQLTFADFEIRPLSFDGLLLGSRCLLFFLRVLDCCCSYFCCWSGRCSLIFSSSHFCLSVFESRGSPGFFGIGFRVRWSHVDNKKHHECSLKYSNRNKSLYTLQTFQLFEGYS